MSEAENRAGLEHLWTRIEQRLRQIVSPGCFQTWFQPVALTACQGHTLCLMVPNEIFRRALLTQFFPPLRQAVTEIAGPDFEVRLSVAPPRQSETDVALLPVVRAAALEIPIAQPTWLIDQLWTHGAVGVIGGSPKSGKSWLALDMAVAVASATPCLGTFPVHTSGPVLLYAAEDSATAVRARLETLSRIRQLDFQNLDVSLITTNSLRLDQGEDQDRLEATVRAHHPVLLVLDPLVRVHAIDENVAGQVSALLGYLRRLQRTTGVALALVHHVKKNASPNTNAGYSLRGSSDLYAWLDSFLSLRHHHGQLTLSAEHRSAPGAGPFVLQLAPPSADIGAHLKLASAGAPTGPQKPDTLTDRVLQALSGATEPMTVENLRCQLQVRNQRVVEALRQLSSQAAIQRLPRGYILSPRTPLLRPLS
jgi:hypothetical protein